ncbi:MAG: tRNA-dihydrouridine synthase [Phycisphaerales bacterium]|nr:MAG: tRNA-dihydrouridine synthase [Phycisphaerales bacterium]
MRSSVGLKLGSLTLDVPFFQASLSGYSDYAMRTLARRFGCPFTMADMILDKSAANPRVLRKACFRPGADEHPVGAQIIGRTPATIATAARDLVAAGYDVIDLNFACPAPKVLQRGRGGALLNDPDTVIDTLKAVRDAVVCPVLMKLRIGVDHKPQSLDSFWEIVTRSIEHGVDGLVIHGRTVSERYRGKADWGLPAAVKSRFPNATVVGSGDIFDPAATVELMKKTGLDGFIVARGAVGNPWIFRDLRCAWENRPLPAPPDLAEQRLVMLEHFERMLQGHPEKRAVRKFRKFVVGYVCRHPKRKPVQMSLMKAKTRAEVEAAIDTWYTDTHSSTDW